VIERLRPEDASLLVTKMVTSNSKLSDPLFPPFQYRLARASLPRALRAGFQQPDEGFFHGGFGKLGRPEAGFHLFRRAFRQNFSLSHDYQAIAIFGFFHEMGGNEERDTLVGKAIDAVPELAACQWVHPGSGFVEKEDLG